MQNGSENPERRNKSKLRKQKQKKRNAYKWAFSVVLFSFVTTAVLSFASEEFISDMPVWAAAIMLLIFISIGIVADTIGIAVATAEISMFNSMAAHKVKSGKKAVWLITNAERVTSFCNDVIGDITSIISGATGAAVALLAFSEMGGKAIWANLVLTSFIAAVTVGFKALGKQFAMNKSNEIVLTVAKILCGFRN